jgi:hypothetical protein
LPTSQPGDASEQRAERSAQRALGGLPMAAAAVRSGPERLPGLSVGAAQRLAPTTQAAMENRFATDLSAVRVHTDAAAGEAARSLAAKAFSFGRHIVFGRERYAPATPSGQQLLAHELAHVLDGGAGALIQRDVDTDLDAATEVSEPTPTPRPDVDEVDYAFIFPSDIYGQSARAFIRRYYPTHRVIQASSFEDMFDRLYTDTRRVPRGHQVHLRELVVVTHANTHGGMRIPLARSDVARHRFFTPWDLDDLQEEFQEGAHARFRERRHTVVSTLMDASTRVVVRGCELGQSDDALEGLRSFFGGQAWVWAPRDFQGYETIPIGSDLLRTPEDAFDFLVQQDFLPAELMPAPDEEKRAYIARVFGLQGAIPAEFFVVGHEARERLGALIAAHQGITPAAEAEKSREPASIPSVGEHWGLAAPSALGDDAELDRLSLRDIAIRAHPLITAYRAENACMLARLRSAWERQETSDRMWMDYAFADSHDPLAGMPGETGAFFAYMANRFRDNPTANPFDGLPVENLFGDSNLIAIDAARYPCPTPHDDLFESQDHLLNYEIPPAETASGTFDDPLAIGTPEAPPPTRAPSGTGSAPSAAPGSDRALALAARARALDFSKSTGTAPEGLDLLDALQRLSVEDLVLALGLAMDVAAGGGDRRYLTAVEGELQRRQLIGPANGVAIMNLSEAEFTAATGLDISSTPMQTALTGGAAGGLYIPEPLWYYRVLTPSDPTAAGISGGADLVPREPNPGRTFEPAASRAEMTFRHTRPNGNVPQVGTDRVSTARSLEAFETILRDRGTGEMVRVDVPAARRLGAEFLEHPEIQLDLNAMERQLVAELEQAQAAGRGANHIRRLQGRLDALRAAREYTLTFQEGHGVGSIPAEAVTPVEGATLSEAVAAERALLRNVRYLRWGGRVLVVVGVGLSIANIATAAPADRPRVASREAGGWAFSLGGVWVGTKAGALVGGALGIESGPGLLVTGGIGALVGGVAGFFVGEEIGDRIYNLF